MTLKEQLSAEQWKALLNAPGAAATFVSTASGGPMEVFNEVFTASKFSAELAVKEGGSGYGALVDELLQSMKGMTMQDARENSVKYVSRDPQGIREEIKSFIADAVAIAESLPEADGYKRWLVDMVYKVAETRTGGILGIGGRSIVDDQEKAAVDELKALMGIL